MKKVIVVLLCITVGKFNWVCGYEQDMPPNAALQYWQAFAMLGELTESSDRKLLRDAATIPAGEERTALAGRLESSMRALHRGSGMAQCDWGTGSKEDGPMTLMPHLSKARELARAACVVTREKFSKGQYEEGIQCAADAMRMARHLSHHGVLISKLVEVYIVKLVVATLAAEVPTMPRSALVRLQQALDQLPAEVPLATVLLWEQENIDWLECHAGDADFQKNYLKAMFEGIPAEEELKHKAILADPVKLKAAIVEIRGLYLELGRCAQKPFKESVECLKTFDAKIASSNAIAKHLFTAVSPVCKTAETQNCILLLLRAGIQITLNGEKDASKTLDPYGIGPYTYTTAKGGFVLTSALEATGGNHFSLNFHPTPPKANTAVLPPKPPAENQGEF